MTDAGAPINFDGLANAARRAVNYDAVMSPDNARKEAGYEPAQLPLTKPIRIREPMVVPPLI